MNFSEALDAVKKGCKISRRGWNGKGMYVMLMIPGHDAVMTRQYLYMVIPDGSSTQFEEAGATEQRVPWIVSQTDLLANDWFLV